MLDILHFIFSSFWIWLGTLTLLLAACFCALLVAGALCDAFTTPTIVEVLPNKPTGTKGPQGMQGECGPCDKSLTEETDHGHH